MFFHQNANRDIMNIKNKKILVVEDEPEILNMNRKILTQFGYTVHCAPNGNEALFLLKEIKKIDLLLTDVVMPGNIDGPFLAEKIQEAFPNVKILFISGYAPKQAASKNIVFTDANLLPKPYTSMQLVQRVRMILAY